MRISDWSSDVCSSDLVESPTHEEAEYVEKKLMDPNQHPPSPAHEEARTEEEDIEPEEDEEEEEEEDEDVAQLRAAPEAIDVTPSQAVVVSTTERKEGEEEEAAEEEEDEFNPYRFMKQLPATDGERKPNKICLHPKISTLKRPLTRVLDLDEQTE